ncbi:hypothetical protein FQA39_LY18738 [Lamprigera yunnana]|nr:hypothetical protein FQA39_LY18738 [Lamprigera yunnana]
MHRYQIDAVHNLRNAPQGAPLPQQAAAPQQIPPQTPPCPTRSAAPGPARWPQAWRGAARAIFRVALGHHCSRPRRIGQLLRGLAPARATSTARPPINPQRPAQQYDFGRHGHQRRSAPAVAGHGRRLAARRPAAAPRPGGRAGAHHAVRHRHAPAPAPDRLPARRPAARAVQPAAERHQRRERDPGRWPGPPAGAGACLPTLGQGFSVRLYRIATHGDTATDTLALDTLTPRDNHRACAQHPAGQISRSLLGLKSVDNIEAMTWGPRLASGERVLLLVLGHRQVGEQLEVLEHHAHAAAQLGQVGLGVVHAYAVDVDLTLLHRLQRVDGFDQGGFARARWAAHHHHFAFFDIGGAVVEHLKAAIPLGDILHFNHLDILCIAASTDDGDLFMQALDKPRQREADDEIQHSRSQISLYRAAKVLARHFKALEHVVSADRVHQRGVLEQDDGLRQQHGQHVAEGLGQHHQAHVLAVSHAQRLPGIDLAA